MSDRFHFYVSTQGTATLYADHVQVGTPMKLRELEGLALLLDHAIQEVRHQYALARADQERCVRQNGHPTTGSSGCYSGVLP